MVKEIVGEGQHYRDFLQDRGFDLNSFNKLFFRQNEAEDGDGISEEGLVLKKLATLPDFNDRSLRVTNVVNTDGSDLHLLLVPKDCPRLKDLKYRPTGEMPKPNESFLVRVWNPKALSQHCQVPVLSSSPDQASHIAKRRFSDVSKVQLRDLETDPVLVTPDEWVEYWRYLILVKKEHCPDFVQRFADLRECIEQVRFERLSNLPSTILR